MDRYRSRLFCFVLTSEENLESRAQAVYQTWGQRCGKLVFVLRLNSSNPRRKDPRARNVSARDRLPIEDIPTLPDENYSHLTEKVRQSLFFFARTYPDFDWYLKADDDTYVIVENLLRFLISTIK